MNPELSIIIVNWNSKDYVRQCVRSVLDNTKDISFEVIVVDGASFDGCGEMLEQEFPEVRFIQSEKNVGFGRANNLGFDHSKGPKILFLNPDTEVLGQAIPMLCDALDQCENVGGVTCQLLNTDRSVQVDCVQIVPTIWNQMCDAEALRPFFPQTPFLTNHGKPIEIEVLPGSCILTRRETFEQAGRFAPEYFMYCEDVDLSYQFRKNGLRNLYVPGASIVHHGGGSSRKAASKFSAVMMRESIWRFLNKTRGRFYGWCYRASTVLAAMCRLVLLGILLLPSAVRGKWPVLRGTFQKWAAILSWALGAETWTRKFD
jgi:GT2 family glycosyltransferase